MSAKPKITATGVKGFLKWLKAYNPTLYSQVAPILPQKMPQLFTQFEKAGGVAGLACRCRSAMGRLGQTGTGFTGGGFTGSTFGGDDFGSTSFGTGSTGAGWDYGTGSTGYGSTGSTGYGTGSTGNTSSGGGLSVPAGAAAAAAASGAPAVDVSDAANPGPLSSTDANTLAQVVGDVASATQSVPAAQMTSNAVSTQLTRASSGLAPLPIGLPVSSSSLGSGLSSISGTGWLIVGGVVLGGALLLSGGSRRAA